ncbi:MAG: hypothetical protein E6R03_15495 [Hyphomicrobiaceae bacterium]|nr:MAG: hypothetical protein E6R03_15495 [Hyphomicrobiaceae bacterium]
MERLSEEQAKLLYAEGFADPAFFCRVFLASWFPLPMPWVHRGILALLTRQTDFLLRFGPEYWRDGEGEWTEAQLMKIVRHFVWRPDPDNPDGPVVPLFELIRDVEGKIVQINLSVSSRTLIIMPRGVSKTTLTNAANIRDICYQLTQFLVYLSETQTHSEMQLDNVKRQLESNALILSVFGVKEPARSDSKKWTQDFIETQDGIVVACRGRGGQVRGLNHNGIRPSKIVIDDVEDKESVKTAEQRNKAMSWLKADVEPALPQIEGKTSGFIVMLGTILDGEALLMKLQKDPEWIVVKFGAMDPDGDPLWPSYMTREKYARTKASFIRMGKLADFNREYDSSLRTEGENTKFPATSVRYEIQSRSDYVGVALVMDPAIGQKKDSDFCSFAVVGMNAKGRVHVFDCYMKQGMTPTEQVDKFFELVGLWRPTKKGIEAVAYQQALVHLVREEQFRKSKTLGSDAYFEIIPILHGRTAKIHRVEGVLSPRYTAGYITHQRRFLELEEQLLDWPNGKKDGPDAVAMALTLLDPYAAFALPEPEEADHGIDKLAKDQYQSLDVVLGNYRSAP